MKTTRRIFLKSSGLALASVGVMPSLGPLFLRSTAFADDAKRNSRAAGGRKTLICIFQRGAVDGLSMVVPHGDPAYYQLRSVGNNGIALMQPTRGGGEESVLDLDGMFGLHPALKMLKPIYDAGHLAPIQACGSPDATRSHFDAQDYMETATPGQKVRDGWLARALLHCPEDAAKLKAVAGANPDSTPLRSVSMTTQVPLSLQGFDGALAIPDLRTFGINSAGAMPAMGMGRRRQTQQMGGGADTGGFESLYEGAVGDVLHGAGQEGFEAIKLLGSIRAENYVPSGGAQYPNGRFGDALRQIAQLVKADVGLEVAFAESGGWDTHVSQGGAKGQLARRLDEFGQGLAALYTDLGDRMADVTILTMSEFGRTARQNGNGGTDHGHATCFLALGGKVQGGKVLGQWPGLSPEHLNEGRDLAVTTDFRDVFGEVAQKHLGVRDLTAVFPRYAGAATPTERFRGVLRT